MSRARRHPPPAGRDAPITPLIPPDRPRPRPAVLGVAALAPQQPATPDHETPLLAVARLDASGRFTSRHVLRALGWAAGHRIGLQVRADLAEVATALAALAGQPHPLEKPGTFD